MARTPDPEVIDRERKVLEARLLGMSFDQIAASLGYASKSGAHHAYKRALQRTIQEPADEVRQQELERLDRLWRGIIDPASRGDVQAINTALRIMERRARYLGLDAPVKAQHEVTVYEGGTEIDREVERLARLLDESAETDSGRHSDGGEIPVGEELG